MPQLMYKKDREPLLVTDSEEGRAVMRKHGWSDTEEAPKVEDKPEDAPKKKRGRPFKESK